LFKHCQLVSQAFEHMATSVALIASVLLGLGPVLLWLCALLFKVPQLFLIALCSAGLYYLFSCLILSVWFAVLGMTRYDNVAGLFVPLAAVLTELARAKLCQLVLAAEAYFYKHDQSLIVASSYSRRLIGLGSSVGLGIGCMYGGITVGTAANAEVAMTWPDHGSATGEWMPASVAAATWVDLENCPQIPKLVNLAIQSLFVASLHVIWSIWMMFGVAAVVATDDGDALRDEDRVPLTPRDTATELQDTSGSEGGVQGEGSPAEAHGVTPPTRRPPRTSVTSPTTGKLLVAVILVLHMILRFASLAGSNAASWDEQSRRWSFTSSRGCVTVMALQGTWLALSLMISLCFWKRAEMMHLV
jgi:hypothetical protein